ncbi:MAG: tryptophanase [Anaerolineae bacterium]|nr:tryptophanase [Anaerolineae bacterium]
MQVRLSSGKTIPMEMHKVRIVQQTALHPIEQRHQAIKKAGFNTFGLRSKDIFLDMLTDSGTNAMSDNQLASMMVSDDAYAGSESFFKLADAVKEMLGFELTIPVHQGRAAEHLIAKTFVKPGMACIMNYHFTTTKAHFEMAGGKVLELFLDEALETESDNPFKGNIDLRKVEDAIAEFGAENVAFIRMEATTNLIGGQPFSLDNLRAVRALCDKHGIILLFDGSLLMENAFFIQQRELPEKSVADIAREMMSLVDLYYMSARKGPAVRGGMIATNNQEFFDRLLPLVPLFEGFSTYGGMSTKEIEAMAVGLREMLQDDIAGSGAEMVEFFVQRLVEEGLPVVTPAGGLACHLDIKRFLPHVPQTEYSAGALAAAFFMVSGVRGMERGTISTDRDEDGNDVPAGVELVRLAVPRRVYTMSHIEFVVDRLRWLFEHRELVGGLTFVSEPPVLRFFFGELEPIGDWDQRLKAAFIADFGAGAC